MWCEISKSTFYGGRCGHTKEVRDLRHMCCVNWYPVRWHLVGSPRLVFVVVLVRVPFFTVCDCINVSFYDQKSVRTLGVLLMMTLGRNNGYNVTTTHIVLHYGNTKNTKDEKKTRNFENTNARMCGNVEYAKIRDVWNCEIMEIRNCGYTKTYAKNCQNT